MSDRSEPRLVATDPVPVDSSLFLKLVRAANLTARLFHEGAGKRYRLSLNEWRVMVVLASRPGVAATDVADATGLDKMTVSRALAALVGSDRLIREGDPLDLRRSRLFLSPAAKRLCGRIGARASQRETGLFGGLSALELKRANATLDKLIEALRQAEPG